MTMSFLFQHEYIFLQLLFQYFSRAECHSRREGLGCKELTFFIKNSLTFCTCSKKQKAYQFHHWQKKANFSQRYIFSNDSVSTTLKIELIKIEYLKASNTECNEQLNIHIFTKRSQYGFFVHIQGGYERYLAFEVLSFQEVFKVFWFVTLRKSAKKTPCLRCKWDQLMNI